MKITDGRTPEGKLELAIQEEADKLLWRAMILDAVRIPGAWIKKHGHKFRYLDKMRDTHFKNIRIK
jgi:hypothetical protein